MTRRVTLAILGTLAAALLLAGLGTLALATVDARRSIVDELESQANAFADIAQVTTVGPADGVPPQQRFQRLARTLRFEGIGLAIVGPEGTITQGSLPTDVDESDLDLAALQQGETVSGMNGDLAYAAAAAQRDDLTVIVVLTRRADPVLGAAVRWFLVAAAITVLLGAVVSVRLSRRLTRPLRLANRATRRIATGDLATRLKEPKGKDELAELSRSINEMAAALERSRGLERQFLLSVSHDLRTPLTSIRGYAEALADGTTTNVRPAAEVVLAEARRLERLVGDLLDLAKLDAQRFSLSLRPVDLAEVAVDTADAFRPSADEAGVRLEVDVGDARPGVVADPDRLAQVAANLIENAIRHAGTAVTITVSDRDVPELVVADDGPGIADEDLPHVFERLYVARHEPRPQEVGSGLGLAIVRELVQAMGGEVAAERGEPHGTRMVVRLRPAALPEPAVASTTP